MINQTTDEKQSYNQVVKNCIEHLDKLNVVETSKLPIIMKLGSEIDTLVASQEDKETLLEKLSRDISFARKKMIDSETLESYHQLYLNYDTPESLKEKVNGLSCDVSAEMISGMMKEGARNKKEPEGSTIDKDTMVIFDKIKNLLIKLEAIFDKHPLNDSNKETIKRKFDIVRDIFNSLDNLVRTSNGVRQQDLFTAKDEKVDINCN